MAKVLTEIDDGLREWIARQRMFFVATAPTSLSGHVNLSPKGPIETFRILGPLEIAYADYYGSGVETIAHLRDSRRIVVMFCAFEGPPRIVRLHGAGQAVERNDPSFASLAERMDAASIPHAGKLRSIVRVDVERVSDSCGFGVPLMDHLGQRTQMPDWVASRERIDGPGALEIYARANNLVSIDGLAGLELLPES